MVVTATDVGTEYDLYSMADELATEYEDVEKVCINHSMQFPLRLKVHTESLS